MWCTLQTGRTKKDCSNPCQSQSPQLWKQCSPSSISSVISNVDQCRPPARDVARSRGDNQGRHMGSSSGLQSQPSAKRTPKMNSVNHLLEVSLFTLIVHPPRTITFISAHDRPLASFALFIASSPGRVRSSLDAVCTSSAGPTPVAGSLGQPGFCEFAERDFAS